MKKSKQKYISAKNLAEDNKLYSFNAGVISLKKRVHWVENPPLSLDFSLKDFCYREQKDELLLLDENGLLLRYYISTNQIQKSAIYDKNIKSIVSIKEIVFLQYETHIEGRFLANGQIIWRKDILTLSISKYSEKLIVVKEESTHKKIILTTAGETLTIENPSFDYVEKDYMSRQWKLTTGKLSYAIETPLYPPQQKAIFPKIIDSFKYNSTWHKVLIDYSILDECDIRMEVLASNEKELTTKDTYIPIKKLHKDTLLPNGLIGRYLFIKIYLIPDQTQQNSPLLKSLKVIYPRSTYLEYLPNYYQEDKSSAMMLERFFSIFESNLSKLEKKRANSHSLINPQETEEENLTWLSSWLGLTYDESWGNRRWRKLISEAPKLFKIRGSRESIQRVIEIYSDMKPLFFEPIHKECQEKNVDNYSFCVFLKAEQYKNIEEVKTIRRIVEEWKPAYTQAHVIPLENNMILGTYLLLEVNTKFEKRKICLGEARLPLVQLAFANEHDMRTLEHVRIQKDAILH